MNQNPVGGNPTNHMIRVIADPSLFIASIGLACLFTVNQGMRITTLTGIYPIEGSLVLRHALAAIVLASLAFWLWKDRKARIAGGRVVYSIVGILLSTAVLTRYSSLFTPEPPLALEFAGKLTEEVLCCVLIVFWASRILREGMVRTSTTVAYAFLIQAALQLLLSFFQRIPCAVMLGLLPLASIGLYCAYARYGTRDAREEATQDAVVCETPGPALVTMRLAAVIVFCLSFMLGGIIFESLDAQSAMADDALSQLCIIGGNALGALVLILSMPYIRNRAYCAVFLMGCFACCAVTLYLTTFLVNEAVGGYLIISSIGLQGTFMFIWYSSFLAGEEPLFVLRRYIGLYCVYICAKVLSASCMLLNQAAHGHLFSILISLSLLGLFCCCAFVVVRSLNTSRSTAEDDWQREGTPRNLEASVQDASPSAQQATPSVEQRDLFHDSVEALADEHGLTRQERRVLLLVAKGLNAGAISEKMVVSVNTAKSHMRNIYAKLNVHSQQEIIALVNERESIGRANELD